MLMCLIFQDEEVSGQFLFLILLGFEFVDSGSEVGGISSEGDTHQAQEFIHSADQVLRSVSNTISTRSTFVNNNQIGKISGHDEIVFNDETSLLGVQDESLDNLGSNNSLFGIQISRRFIDQINISGLTESQNQSDSLKFTTREGFNFVIFNVVDMEGSDDIGDELRISVNTLQSAFEELIDATFELGSNFLGLVRNVQFRNFFFLFLILTSEHSDEGGLTSTVFTEHDDDLGVGETTGFDLQLEGAQSLAHVGILVGGGVGKFLINNFSDLEGKFDFSESQVFSRDETGQEDVDTFSNGERHGNDTVGTGFTVQAADEIGKIIQDTQIVLNANDVNFRAEETSDTFGSSQSLLDIQVRTGLIQHVYGFLLHGDNQDGKSLELTTGQVIDVSVQKMGKIQLLEQYVADSSFVLLGNNILKFTLDKLGDRVDVLGLDGGLELVFQELGEEVLEFRTSEVLDDISPIRRVFKVTQIGLDLVGQDLEGSGLSCTITSDQSEDLTGSGGGKSVKLETVGTITMGSKLAEVSRKIDNLDGFEWALLDAETATDTEIFRDVAKFGGGGDFDTEFAGLVDGAALSTFLLALLGLAFISVDNGNSELVVHC